MHELEPHFLWRDMYRAEEDQLSPFYGREYSEFEFTNQLYNYLIHPQWDTFGSETLFAKLLYADYLRGFCILELMGEWNDTLNNDIMWLKREVADGLIAHGIIHFILIGENVLNFHYSDDSYYEEWFEDVSDQDGWIALVNFQPHVMREMAHANVDSYMLTGAQFDDIRWRTRKPYQVFDAVAALANQRLLG